MQRQQYSSGAKWEPIVGYSRVVRVGPHVYITGTTSIDQATGAVVGPGGAYLQTVQVLKNITTALEQVGARLEHVVRTRIFVTDISQWEAVGRAHGEVFGTILPATTMVEVSKLIDPQLLVEIEADAVVVD